MLRPITAAALSALALSFTPAAFAASYGIGTVDSDGPGGNPAVTYEEVKFYKPSTSSFPTYVGTATPADLCTSGSVKSDICGQKLSFDTQLGGVLEATSTYTEKTTTKTWDWKKHKWVYETTTVTKPALVMQDLKPAYGGLGVIKSVKSNGSAVVGGDEINANEVLTLTFSNVVNVVGFHFMDADHGWASRRAYGMLSVDGGAFERISLASYVTNDPTKFFTGTSFSFMIYDDCGDTDYYLGAVKIAAVPEPGTYALMLAGLGAVAFVARRSKRA
ncbi:MAG: PEP-CTERM sorting domain-containing protein [Pseudomonadota bacterium]